MNPESFKDPLRIVTVNHHNKYTAVCFIYNGIEHQDLYSFMTPMDFFNRSNGCVFNQTYESHSYALSYGNNISLSDDRALVKVPDSNQASAIGLYEAFNAFHQHWMSILLIWLVSLLFFHIAISIFRRSSIYHVLLNYLMGGRYQQVSSRISAMPTVDEQGTIRVGKISFNPRIVLGYGSKGTCVFKGTFENSIDCAVKRVVSQYLTLADREVDFLRSLQHPNLVRYLATEEDAQFIYISLELAEFTLGELVEAKRIEDIGLSKEELCRQSALGLQHLHKLDIVHRDVKPQNILISFPMRPNNERKVMISDFGLSKQLSNLDTGHTSSAMRYFDGTQGWMAPEIVNAKISEDKNLLPTKSADIFSLGCVFYYIISEGQHPFGKLDQRQANILKNNCIFDLFNMKNENNLIISEEKAVLASKLIRSMIQQTPEERPPISTILKYPLFWSQADQLQFIQDVSDRVDKEERETEIVRRLERNKQKIFAYGWKICLGKELQDDLRKHRAYNERSVRDLLRAIRNKKNHYRELPDDLKCSLGDMPEGFMNYFSSRFPELLPHIYHVMQAFRGENAFRIYYDLSEMYDFT